MKKILTFIILCIILVISSHGECYEIAIRGAVKNHFILSEVDIKKFQSSVITLGEVDTTNKYNGIFVFRGVSLKSILKMAKPYKEKSCFKKCVDMAIVVKNIFNKTVVLSWGEVFYRNPDHIILAYEATPVKPHKNCISCHKPAFFQPLLKKLNRKILFPKLIISDSFYTDRCIEGVKEIILIYPSASPGNREKRLYSDKFVVSY